MLIFPSFFNAAAGGYKIDQSLRFDRASSHYLNETFAAGQNTWTVSFWVKRANLNGVVQCLFGTSTNGFYNDLAFDSSDRLRFRQYYTGASSENFEMLSSMRFRDPSAWYHIVLSYGAHDGSAAADRAKIWVNNQRLTAFDTANYPGANVSSLLNANNRVHNIGKVGFYADYLDAYIAEFNFIDGQRLDPTDFGEEDDNGVWRPIKFAGTYGNNNSVYLKFDPSATNGIGHDHSGNGNNFSPTGFDTTNSTASTYDVMSDTPTTNWCTLNPNDSFLQTVSNGNLVSSNTNNVSTPGIRASMAMSSGKWYWEITCGVFTTLSTWMIGVADSYQKISIANYTSSSSYLYYSNNGQKYNGSGTSYGATYTTGDVIGVAYDADNGKIWFAKNNTWQNSGDPAAGTGEAYSGITGDKSPYVGTGLYQVESIWNFGQRAFAYTPPTGFKALNTANLPAPTVKDGSKYFDTKLYQGNEGDVSAPATQTITGLNFAPDFVWIKCLNSSTANHSLFDQVRGTGKTLWSQSTSNEQTDYTRGYLSAFTPDGFTVRAGSTDGRDVNGLGSTGSPPTQYVAWNWLAGGTGSSIAAGSIDGTNPTIASTVSANPTAGFSIVTWTAVSGGGTIGHGLGVAPSMIIVKSRSTGNWNIYHQSLGNTKAIYFTGGTPVTSSVYWNNTSPTSSLFTVGSAFNTAGNLVTYCFAEVEGYSKFGSYVGNGDPSGPFVFCGFKPRWIMIKRTDLSQNWPIVDTKRDTYNVANKRVFANLSSGEDTGIPNYLDILSNGFKCRDGNVSYNASGGTYIFMALAENPFGGDGVSPATAR
jgi:hypothetical protein